MKLASSFGVGNRSVLRSVSEDDPRRVCYIHTGQIGRLPGASIASPPSADFLRKAGVVAPFNDPERYFDPASRKVARWLSTMGIESLSVRDSVLTDVKTPDGVLADGSATWEVKAPQTPKGIARGFEHARRQSPCLILWTQAFELSCENAVMALERQLPKWGADYREVIIILGNGTKEYVHWIRERYE